MFKNEINLYLLRFRDQNLILKIKEFCDLKQRLSSLSILKLIFKHNVLPVVWYAEDLCIKLSEGCFCFCFFLKEGG